MKLYRSIMARYAKGANVKDVFHVYGMAVAYETVKVLTAAGKNPTRAGVMAQVRKLNNPANPFLLPGIVVRTSATERFPVEQALMQRWSKGAGRGSAGSGGIERDRIRSAMDELLDAPLEELLAAARERRRGGGLVTYSPKVFIPLTTLCRDVCGYCTFARPPRRGERAYLSEDEVLAIARAGAAPGAPRRCSRSATGPSCATRSRGRSSRRSAARRRSSTSAGSRSSCSRRPGCCRT